jgi:hypothetical protein
VGLFTKATGNWSTAIGATTEAKSFASLVIGQYNVASGTAGSWMATEPLFVIGNGTKDAVRSNALTVLKNGTTGIGTANPDANAMLDVVSTTKAFIPPRMTTAQKFAIPSPTEGMVVYDTDLHKLSVFTTATWETVSSAIP